MDLSIASKSKKGIFFLWNYVGLGAVIGSLVGIAIGLSLFDQFSHKSIVERIQDQYWILGLPGLLGGALAGAMVARLPNGEIALTTGKSL